MDAIPTLVSDETVRTRVVRVVFGVPIPIATSWRGARQRAALLAIVEREDFTSDDRHHFDVKLRGGYVLKSGDLGSERWEDRIWDQLDPLRVEILAAAAALWDDD